MICRPLGTITLVAAALGAAATAGCEDRVSTLQLRPAAQQTADAVQTPVLGELGPQMSSRGQSNDHHDPTRRQEYPQ